MTPEERLFNLIKLKGSRKIMIPFTTYDTNNEAKSLLPRVQIISKNIKFNFNNDEIEIKS